MNRCVCFLVMLLFVQTSRGAQPLVWQSCVREALRDNPELRAARAGTDRAEAVEAQARSTRRPQVLGEGQYDYTEQDAVDEPESWDVRLMAEQLLYDGGRSGADVGQAAESRRATEYSYKEASADVRFKLRTAFVDMLAAQGREILAAEILKRRVEHTRLVNLRYKGGREHKGSLMVAQANQAQAQFEVERAGRGLRVAAVALAERLGRLGRIPTRRATETRLSGTLTQLAPTKTAPGSAPRFEALAEENPLVWRLAAERESAAHEVRAAESEYYPSLHARGTAGSRESGDLDQETYLSIAVFLRVPLWEGGRTRATSREARARLEQIEAEKQARRNSVLLQLYRRWTEFQDAVGRLSVRRRFAAAAEERATIAGAQYSAGNLNFDNWIIIEDDFVLAKTARLDAEAAACLAEAEWFRAKGETLEDEIAKSR